ncbi:MAG: zinc ribbon domain-containing protein [Dictyoglomaceae bacterium]|nr:zinc ribbon domain-containing protein [Dictyoglomaceae bacterium]
MPIYEYRCYDCGNIFEKLAYKEEEIECPNCGGKNIKKLISIFSSPGSGRGSACSSCTSRSCNTCK